MASGPPCWASDKARVPAWARARRLLFQMLLEEVHGALPRGLGARLVEAPALVAMEAVLRIGIDEYLTVAAALLLDHLDVAHRNGSVLLAEVHLRRHFRLLVGILGDLPAVIADGGGETVELAGREEGDGAAHAEADDGDRPILLQFVDGGLRVLEHRPPIRVGDVFARIGDLVRRIAAFEVLLLSVEQRRRNRGIAYAREPVADRPNVVIDAEDLLDDYDAAFGRAGRVGAIGTQLKLVG